jgi:hypothetical protein
MSFGADDGSGYDELIWALVYREGPLGREALSKLARTKDLDAVLARLISSGRVRTSAGGAELEYYASEFVVPRGSPVGWEAAVFDHFQAVVKTIAQRVGGLAEGREQQIGGSTYSFDVWPGHPHEQEALDQLKEFRARTSALREKIREHNRAQPHPASFASVTVYAGQSVIDNARDDVATSLATSGSQNES